MPQVNDDPSLNDYNADQWVDKFVQDAIEQDNHTLSSHQMWACGADFQFQNADHWYRNRDKLTLTLTLTLNPTLTRIRTRIRTRTRTRTRTRYRNLDKLIHYVNLNGSVNAFYSTPARYTDEKKKWQGSYEVRPRAARPLASCYTPLSLVLHAP